MAKRHRLSGFASVITAWCLAAAGAINTSAQETAVQQLDTAATTSVTPAGVLPTVSAATAIVINRDTGAVLGSKNADTLRPNPSTTKIMTALIAIERNAANLDVIAGPVSVKAANTYGSTMNLEPGDTVSLRDLLYGLMLPSGNDAGVAIAEWISGSEDAFVGLMNDRAKSLGLNNTSYRNAFGYDPVELPAQCVAPYSSRFNCGHYTTARDLAALARVALRQPTFARIVQTVTWQPTSWLTVGRTPRSLSLVNDNLLLSSMPYSGANGVKTGMSTSAGFCMVATATRSGRSVLTVVMGCGSDQARHQESQKLLDWGFSQLAGNGPVVLPKISVNAVPTTVTRGGDATFVISTSQSDSTQPTTIRYSMSGTAQPGSDYSLTGTLGEVDIPAGATSAQVVLHAFNGDPTTARRNRRAAMKIMPGTTYRVAVPKKATVTIGR